MRAPARSHFAARGFNKPEPGAKRDKAFIPIEGGTSGTKCAQGGSFVCLWRVPVAFVLLPDL